MSQVSAQSTKVNAKASKRKSHKFLKIEKRLKPIILRQILLNLKNIDQKNFDYFENRLIKYLRVNQIYNFFIFKGFWGFGEIGRAHV